MKFGKIIGTVRKGFDSGANFDNTNWGFSERETKIPFSFLSPADPSPEGKIEFLNMLKSSSPREIHLHYAISPYFYHP